MVIDYELRLTPARPGNESERVIMAILGQHEVSRLKFLVNSRHLLRAGDKLGIRFD